MKRMLLLTITVPTIAYFSGLSRHAANKTPRHIEVKLETPCLDVLSHEYQVNLGKAIDVLSHDYPSIMQSAPDFSIFSDNIHICSGDTCLEGMQQYMRGECKPACDPNPTCLSDSSVCSTFVSTHSSS